MSDNLSLSEYALRKDLALAAIEIKKTIFWKKMQKRFSVIAISDISSGKKYYCVFAKAPFKCMYILKSEESLKIVRDASLLDIVEPDSNFYIDGLFLSFSDIDINESFYNKLKKEGIRFSKRANPEFIKFRSLRLPSTPNEEDVSIVRFISEVLTRASSLINSEGFTLKINYPSIPLFSYEDEDVRIGIETVETELRYPVFNPENLDSVRNFIGECSFEKDDIFEAAIFASPFVAFEDEYGPFRGEIYITASYSGDSVKIVDSDEYDPTEGSVVLADSFLNYIKNTGKIPGTLYARNMKTAYFLSSLCNYLGIKIKIAHSSMIYDFYNICLSKSEEE